MRVPASVRRSPGLVAALALAAGALVAMLGLHLGQDVRIRMRTLLTMEPPPGPLVVRVGEHTLSVSGALVRSQSDRHRLVLRAWAPTPTVEVVEAGRGEVRMAVENLPRRVRLEAVGPVREERLGTTRVVDFSPAATGRLGFADRSAEVTFAALGDTGDDPTWAEALRRAAEMEADFFLHLGDLIYSDNMLPNIVRIMEAAPLPIYMVRGNHDYRNQERIDFMRGLGPPYYLFRMGGASFIVLDNSNNYLPGFWRRSTQYRWFTGMLGLPREGPLFVAAHKPPFDRRPDAPADLDDRPFAQALMRDFVRAGVRAVFAGHAHATHLWMQDGIPYVINGEGYQSPEGPRRHRMAWVRVRGWDVDIRQVPIWTGSQADPSR
jgi:predicted phosphodiesterase